MADVERTWAHETPFSDQTGPYMKVVFLEEELAIVFVGSRLDRAALELERLAEHLVVVVHVAEQEEHIIAEHSQCADCLPLALDI